MSATASELQRLANFVKALNDLAGTMHQNPGVWLNSPEIIRVCDDANPHGFAEIRYEDEQYVAAVIH